MNEDRDSVSNADAAATGAEVRGRKNKYGEYELTGQQQAVVDHIVDHDDLVTAVDASAGTGKTFTLIRAVLTIILSAWRRWQESDGERPRIDIDHFVLITFTNKAADELQRKLQEALLNRWRNGPENEKGLWKRQLERASGAFVGTIHSFCKGQILRPFGYDEGVARQAGATFSARLLDDAIRDVMEAYAGGELDRLVIDDMSDAGRIRSVLDGATEELFDADNRLPQYRFEERMREAITLVHNRGYSTEQMLRWTVERQNDQDQRESTRHLFAALVRVADHLYGRKKAEEHVVDQYDMLDRAVQLLEQSSGGRGAADLLAVRYRYLFIDEFQDTDALQKRIVDALIEALDGILVVGDWKQSIYRFRGAEPELLNQIADEYMTANRDEDGGSRPFPLRVSSRPSEPLRTALNTLFGSVGRRFEGLGAEIAPWVEPWEPQDDIPEVIVRGAGFNDESARIEAAAETIGEILGQTWDMPPSDMPPSDNRRPVDAGDIVVLCRTNADVETYVRGLAQHGVDARPDSGQPFYAMREVVSVYRMLRLILNEEDSATLAAALPTPYFREVNLTDRVRDAVQYGIQKDNYLLDRFEKDHPDLLSRASSGDGGAIGRLRASVRERTASQILDQLYDEFDILTYYQEEGNTAAVQNLQRLREIARTLANDDQALTLRAFADYLRRAIETEQDEERVEAGETGENDEPPVSYVRVMTIHKAKGLEFPFVIIPEMQRDLVRDWAPDPAMIFHSDHGLDVSVYPERNGIPDTRSSRFQSILDEDNADAVREEMRVFYVAATRAQHSVIFIGDGHTQPPYEEARDAVVNDAGDLRMERCSWQDEVLHARTELEILADADDNIVEVDFQFED